MGFLGIGVVIGTFVALAHFLITLLPYVVLAATLSDKDKDNKK